VRSDPTYNARFGFVEFTEIPMAHTACMLNGLMLAERSLRVSMAKTGMSKPAADPLTTGPTIGNMRVGLGGQMITNKPNNDPERVARTIHISGVDGQVRAASRPPRSNGVGYTSSYAYGCFLHCKQA
jgi:hypothetical protein